MMMNMHNLELQKKIFKAVYEINELWKHELFIGWKVNRDISWTFSEVRLNYFELKKAIDFYLIKTKDFQLAHTLTISRNQRILIQKLSNFLFSCDKYYDNLGIKNYHSDIHSFFLHLRNFITHKSQFPLISMMKFQEPENIRFESFSKKQILEYLEIQIEKDRNNKKVGLRLAKEFTLQLENSPNILPLLHQFYLVIEEDFTTQYLDFFKGRKSEFEEFFKDISKIKEKNKALNVCGITPPLRDSEIRLIRFLIKKS
jgi:hypothetical protein